MLRILLVKTSSLGDVVHNLPVVNDLVRAFAGVVIDWVAEESFAAVPRMHAGVHAVIPVAVRRWRRSLFDDATRTEIRAFHTRLREHAYDAVIDTQGLLKSALITRAARGTRYGLDWRSSREPLRCFYDRTFRVPWTQHAVERNRSLVAQALGYQPGRLEYGITATVSRSEWLPAVDYAVLLHATSATRKLWSEAHWVFLGNYLIKKGILCVLPWGNKAEHARGERLQVQIPGAIVPPQLNLVNAASLLGGARVVIGVDTGLTHLAVALGAPTVGIYCATDPAATGLYGSARAVNLGNAVQAPSVEAVRDAVERLTT